MAAFPPADAVPVLWLNPGGQLLVAGRPVAARLTGGTKPVKTPVGLGLDFDGGHGGFLIPDFPVLRLTRSLTAAAWIYVRRYTPNGFQSQVLFRGDDRSGLDPYFISVENPGKVVFSINGADGGGASARADIPLKAWVRVTGVFDEEANEVRIYLGNRLVATTSTQLHPFAELRMADAPGVSIGNVQNDKGPHNQPMDGIVADVRLYDGVLTPREAGYVGEFRAEG